MKRIGDTRRGLADLLVVDSSLEDIGAVLQAHLHAQRMRDSRRAVLHLLAGAGGLCWIFECWPGIVPSRWHVLALAGWPLSLGLLLLFGILERRWNTRLRRLTNA